MDQSPTTCQWVTGFDQDVARAIVALIDSTVTDGGTLGYTAPLTGAQANAFIDGLKQRIAGGDTHLLLGRSQAEGVFMVLLTQSSMPNCRHRAELSKGVVHPSRRGTGCVRVAFHELLRHADRLGVEQLVLDVREGSRAHQLWRHYGFETFGVLEDYARVGGERHRGHFMAQTVERLRQRLSSAS